MTKEQLKQLETDLWAAADNLRANSDLKASEYSTPVLGLIFLKFADNNYRKHEHEILEEYQKLKGTRREKPISEIAIEKCGFYLPDHARYNHLLNLPEQEDIANAIKKAMEAIAEYKPELQGVLPQDEYTRLTRTDKTIPNQLLKNFADIPPDASGDMFGQIYEYFLGEFAKSEGQKGGEFFTPRSVVRLMVEIIEPYRGTVFDPACGSGGMFVQSAQFIERHRNDVAGQNGKNGRNTHDGDIYVYGQEKTLETVKLAKMNLAVNGLRGEVRQANSYYEDPYASFGKFDYVMANPPFNVDDVSVSSVDKDRRFKTFGIPRNKSKLKKSDQGKETVPNANYLWINLFAASLKPHGRAALVMANSASDARHSEADIRQTLIEKNLIYGMLTLPSNMFYTVTLPATLWFFDAAKADERILFIDARNIFTPIDRAHREFSDEQIQNIAIISHLHKGKHAKFVQLIDGYFAQGMAKLSENKTQVEPVSEQLVEVLDDTNGQHAVAELVAQWAGLSQLQTRYATYQQKQSDQTDVAKKNQTQHQLREAFDPFFIALHSGLKQLDTIVRQHEKQQTNTNGKRSSVDRQTKALKTALEALHTEVKTAFTSHPACKSKQAPNNSHLTSPMPNFISEDDIEQALLQNLQHLHGFDVLECYTADPDDLNDGSGRTDKRDVIFTHRLKEASVRLNPSLPESAIDEALATFTAKRQAMSLIGANRELDSLIRDGIPVEFENAEGRNQHERVRLIDFDHLDKNRYLAVSQLWIKGERRYRRPDVLLYINGIPLVFIELKNSNVKLRTAFDDNLTNYKADIPQLFLTNAFCILSNATETRVGSITSEWPHFFTWLRADDEKEKINREKIREDGISLERAVAGVCTQDRLLDYVENFVLYYGKNQKIIAQNHQFIGVNNAYGVFQQRKKKHGKLGVFWHTQGSGKSFSMIFYARKIFRKQPGNFTFVVVTDREDLDGQIYKNFLNTGTVTKAEAAQPKDSAEMRKFLGQNKRLVFTLIHKFRYAKGKAYPLLSDRDDIIVIVDEAHRTQYKSLAENMRAGLPNAQYLAFTGTPLLGRERKTNAWFGNYVSEYNFQQSMDDGATVPLFYEKRVPEVLIQNEDLSQEFYDILEDENLDDAQQAKLEKRFAREIEVIKRDDRLETIAKDIVYHFPRRGYLGKGLVITLDKFTAVRMYNKVQRLWKAELKDLRGRIQKSSNDIEKARLKKIVDYMRTVQMAVVISEEAGEEDKFKQHGLDIKPHRERMNRLDKHGGDVEDNFKDPAHPLQLVFVCAMWLTGFDAPTVSTLYMDKPQKDHTLMQTIARANRVTSWQINAKSKINGEIIDYYNVFRNMKKALKDYAQGEEGLDEPPVREKAELFRLLEEAVQQGLAFCHEKGIALGEVLGSQNVFENLGRFEAYADILLSKDEWRKAFHVYENTLSSLYEACKPEILGRDAVRPVAVFQYLRGIIESKIDQQDISALSLRIGELLDESVVIDNAEKFAVQEHSAEYQMVQKGKTWDLSKINFEKLKADFQQATYKNIEIADLRAFIEHKLEQMLQQNITRADFAQRLQQIIDVYNAGGSATESYFEDLMNFAKDMQAEDERHVREGLSEDELELFDLLKKDRMTQDETQKVKLAAKSLLHRLLQEAPKVLVQDWYKDSQSQKIVRTAVEQVLDENLPNSYDRILFKEKCDTVFELMLDYASTDRKWAA